MFLVAVLLVSSMIGLSRAQESPNVTVTLDRTTYSPGDNITATIQISSMKCQNCLIVEMEQIVGSFNPSGGSIAAAVVNITTPASASISSTGGTLTFTILSNVPAGQYMLAVGIILPDAPLGSAPFTVG